jgi:hypothetical protein
MSEDIITTRHGLTFIIDTQGFDEDGAEKAVSAAHWELNRLSTTSAFAIWAAAKLDGLFKFGPGNEVIDRLRSLERRASRAAGWAYRDEYVSIGAWGES